MKGEDGGAADPWAIQQPQGQALHEGQRGGLGRAVVNGARDGRLGQDGVDADHVAVTQLQHTRKEGLGRLQVREEEMR